MVASYQQADGDVLFEVDAVVRLGVLGGDSLHLHKAPGGLYHHELRDALRERGDRIEDGVPKQALERRFEAFRGREAELPPELAAKRG